MIQTFDLLICKAGTDPIHPELKHIMQTLEGKYKTSLNKSDIIVSKEFK
jgi:hypothetical protein